MTTSLEFDKSYLKTLPGILRLFILICSFLGFWSIVFSSVPTSNPRSALYLTVIILGFITTSLVLLARLFQFWEKRFNKFDYVKCEMYGHAGLALAYFLTSIYTITLDVVSFSIATFFSLLAFCGYLGDAALSYQVYAATQTQTQTSTATV